jgi:amino acid permease
MWLLKATGLSSLLVWISIGLISLRFRQAYKVQGLSLSDLPYRQPFYPLLPIVVLVLGTLMFIALGYASARQEPFNPRVSAIFYITNDFRTHAKLFFSERGCNLHWRCPVCRSISWIYDI